MKKFFQRKDLGLAILRISLGVIMIIHGVPKFLGGQEMLRSVGLAMGYLGIHFWPTFWGFLAAFSEVAGGFFLIIGFLFRPSCFCLLCTMVVAIVYQVSRGEDFSVLSHPLTMAAVFFALMFVGPGKYSLQKEIAE